LKYCDYNGFEFDKGKSNGQRYISITNPNETKIEQDEFEEDGLPY
jgi:hypothetical protein